MKKQIIAILAIALVVIGSAFAVTVNYLSNSTAVTAQVTSPIVATVSNDDVTFGESTDLGTVFGGDTKSLYVKTINYANNGIANTVLEIVIIGLTCEEMTSSMGTCTDDAGTLTIAINNDYMSAETKDQLVYLTFAPNIAPNLYAARAQVMYG